MRAEMKSMNRAGLTGRLGLTLALVLPVACIGEDSLTSPPVQGDKGSIPWAVNLQYEAMNVAVGEQVQLTVSPEDVDGDPIPLSKLPPVEFTVSDTSAVRVDANGLLTALKPASSILVIATIEDEEVGWRVADSSRVRVLAEPYPAAGLKLLALTETVQPANRNGSFFPMATDAAGQPLVTEAGDTISPLTYFEASVPQNQYYFSNSWSGTGIPRNLSEPTVRARTYLFGQLYSDSVKVTVTYPDSVVLYITAVNTMLRPSPSRMVQTDITILKGGKVTFRQNNTTGATDDIIFDDLGAVIDGNIPAVSISTVTFPNVGKFTYRSTTMPDVRGTVTVVEPPPQ